MTESSGDIGSGFSVEIARAWEAGVPVDNDIGLFFRSFATPDWERFDQAPRVVAVTGSNGKSTTTALIAQVRAGFVPQPEAVGAFGYDFRQVVEMIREANALLDEAGLSLDSDPRRVAKSGAAQDAAQLAAIEIAATGAASPRADASAAPNPGASQ